MQTTLLFNENGRQKDRPHFDAPGMYTLVREEYDVLQRKDVPWEVNVFFTPGDLNKAAVGITEGWRGDAILGSFNRAAGVTLKHHHRSVFQMNYGGYDHYGRKEDSGVADPGTICTNVNDIDAVIKFIPNQNVIMGANSYSITPVLLQPNREGRIITIAAFALFPDFVQKRVFPRLDANTAEAAYAKNLLETQGYFTYPQNGRMIKVTKHFLESARTWNTSCQSVIDQQYKPEIIMVRSAEDEFIADPSYIPAWAERLKGYGYTIIDHVVPGKAHIPTRSLGKALIEELHAYEARVA